MGFSMIYLAKYQCITCFLARVYGGDYMLFGGIGLETNLAI